MSYLKSGKLQGPAIILHGGAGEQDQRGEGLTRVTEALKKIAKAHLGELLEGRSGLDVVEACLHDMEQTGLFTAGRGSYPQGDGVFRLSAAIMDGRTQRLSGVLCASDTCSPSKLARHLQSVERGRVLCPPGTTHLAKSLGLPVTIPDSPRTEARLAKLAAEQSPGRDTVGCIVLMKDGSLAAGTSTGGLGNTYPGRVSDAGTVAGTYASEWIAVSATGIGEEIADDAVAARLETRCRDGLALAGAAEKTLAEASSRKRDYGWISISRVGEFAVAYTSSTMSFVVIAPNTQIHS